MRVAPTMLAATLFGVLANAGSAAPLVSPVAMTCLVDDEIAPSDRAAPDRVALDLVENFVRGDAASVNAALSPEARTVTPLSELETFARSAASMSPYTDLRVAHTYLIRVTGGRDPLSPMICGKTLKDPDAVFLTARAIPRQTYVEVVGHTKNNDWSSFVWLAPNGSSWQALAFSFNASATSGRSARDLRDLAIEQEGRGHDLNAAVLARAAEGLSARGPNATPVWRHDLDEQLSSFRIPPELSGPPPFTWKLAGETWRVGSVNLLGVGGDLNLQIDRLTDAWPGDNAIDAENHRLLDALVQAHPELKDSFAAILVRAIKPDGSGGWGTVYDWGRPKNGR